MLLSITLFDKVSLIKTHSFTNKYAFTIVTIYVMRLLRMCPWQHQQYEWTWWKWK